MNGREDSEKRGGGGADDMSDDSSLSDLSSPRDLPDDYLLLSSETATEEPPAAVVNPVNITLLPSLQEELPHGVEASIEVYMEEEPSADEEEKPHEPATDIPAPEPRKERAKTRPSEPDACGQAPVLLRLPPLREGVNRSLVPSLSVLTDHSEVSSAPSLVSSSSKATTPVDADMSIDVARPLPASTAITAASATAAVSPSTRPSVQAVTSPVVRVAEPPDLSPVAVDKSETPPEVSAAVDAEAVPTSTDDTQATRAASTSALPPPPSSLSASPLQTASSAPPKPASSKPFRSIRIVHKVRPKASIPADLSAREYARQCVAAAESSRLNPYALHEEERVMLRQHISFAQVTTYLNIRNGILRLWVRRPRLAVTRQEAMGCAKDSRWFDAASVCFHWLLRRGYINYGCVQMRGFSAAGGSSSTATSKNKRKRIVVIGAGFAGLGCARQLDSLFKQYASRLAELGHDELPEVVVLEGRNRIGGRVYSKPFQQQTSPQHFRCTAEMGGMIITGFDRGNPLNILLRGQLGIPYHALWSEMMLYDTDGRSVDSRRDNMVEDLFNECLDRVSQYKFKLPVPTLVEGNRDLMDEGRDSAGAAEGHRVMAQAEEAQPVAAVNTPVPGPLTAAYKVKKMGWTLRPGVSESRDLDLDPAAKAPGATLGLMVDEAIRQYQDMVDMSAQDLRLLNWHIANLEYSNAINHAHLSLQGWDIDAGNEWEGKHSMVIGGYQSVARGLMLCPTPLAVERNAVVTQIAYREEEEDGEAGDGTTRPVTIACADGRTVEADYVVNTIPLGVLKHGDVVFDPPLPAWKTDAIDRLGYGVLNKLMLTFPHVFWDGRRDIFGVLREPSTSGLDSGLDSLDQADYVRRRGRMFQWFNVTTSAGLPCLLALLAGDAADDAETMSDDALVAEAMVVLRSVFERSAGAGAVPDPLEAFVTRWASDPFARGSYSSAGPTMRMDDYDAMARPVGRRLLFAGEHTSGTHPATVHGAYLSGLRAAGDLLEALLGGPVEVPTPLVVLKRKAETAPTATATAVVIPTHRDLKASLRQRRETREQRIQDHVRARIGDRPLQPARVIDTSYLLFSKANYERARRKCEEAQRSRRKAGHGSGNGHAASVARALPNDVRVLTSKMWRSASAEERQPFAEQAAAEKKAYLAAMERFAHEAAAWDAQAAVLRAAYEKEHPDDGRAVVAATTRVDDAASRSPSATATPRASPHGGRRLRRGTSFAAEGDSSDVEMTG